MTSNDWPSYDDLVGEAAPAHLKPAPTPGTIKIQMAAYHDMVAEIVALKKEVATAHHDLAVANEALAVATTVATTLNQQLTDANQRLAEYESERRRTYLSDTTKSQPIKIIDLGD